MIPESQRWVIVARVLRPRGNKGEVAAELLTDFPERLTRLTGVYLGPSRVSGNTEPRSIALKSCWLSQNHKGQAVFHFEGCNSISEAEKFRGFEVLLPIEKRVSLPLGQYFVDDLIGCSVFEASESRSVVSSSASSLPTVPSSLGVVKEVQFTGEGVSGTPLLVVETPSGELLVPLAEDICTRINIAARRIEVVLPEGLRNLNDE
ncbi:MAG: hypothetical protein WBE13_19965 [Candidatus Acidiferrum sp.]